MSTILKASNATTDYDLPADEYEFITELIGLSGFIEQSDSLEDSLKQLSSLVAHLLKVDNCSIMLLKDSEESSAPKLRVLAHHGFLPDEAYQQSVSMGQGISGQVASTGEPLLIAEIRHSSFAVKARRPLKSKHEGFISCPLIIADKVIGVMNLSSPDDGRVLAQSDLTMVSMVALLVSKSIQVFQLQHILNTNFIQLALARETQTSPRKTVMNIAQDGAHMSKLLAKSFFKEMQSAGFGSDHIIGAATEIISLLNSELSDKKNGHK